jgi:putative ABC transport system permease protein
MDIGRNQAAAATVLTTNSQDQRGTMLGLAPWLRAPLLLLRRPGVALALLAAAFVATLPAAAAPLFLSSARNAALNHQIAQACPWVAGAHLTSHLGYSGPLPAGVPEPTGPVEFAAHRREKMASLAPPGLSAPVNSLWLTADTSAAGRSLGPANVMTRDGSADHVRLQAGGTGPGVWLPDRFARDAGLSVGDRISVTGHGGVDVHGERVDPVTVTVPVAAIYTDLRAGAADPYWCAHRRLYEGEPGQEFSNRPIAPLVLVDEATFTGTLLDIRVPVHQDTDFALTDPDMDVTTASALADGLVRMRAELRADPLTSLDFQANMRLPDYVPRTNLVRSSLVPPVLSITAAGVGVGLLVVAAAALFWVQRRRRELTVLAAHGVGPAALGVKGLAEALPALVAGAAAGWYAALLLVRWVGPSDVISADAVPRSLMAAGAALLAALLVAAVAAAARSRSLTDVVSRHRRLRLLGLPWELVLVAAGVAAWFWLDDSRATSNQFGAVAQVPGKLLIVPILVIIGCAALAGRLATRWLRRRARRPGSSRPALFIASRRLSREAAIATMLACATAIPIAFAAYGSTVNGSVRATLAAEAKFMVGADVVVTLAQPAEVPPALAGRAAEVLRVNGVVVGGLQTDILIIDPDTFARDAFWDDRPIGMSLSAAMDIVRAGGAVGAWPLRAGDQDVSYLGRTSPPIDLRAVDALPAVQGGYPTMLMSRDHVSESAADLLDRGVPQLWVRGDPAAIRSAVVAAGLPLARINVARDLYADTVFEAVTYTFDYLAALSLLTGLITTVGLLLYLESRAPAHRRGYALLRRMRLRPRAHRTALAVELTTPLIAGLIGGVALAAGIVQVLADEFEINPVMPPGTVVAVPYTVIAVTAATVAVIALLAVGYAQRRVGRATPAEVLREVV